MLKSLRLSATLTAIALLLMTGCSNENNPQNLVAAQNRAALKQAAPKSIPSPVPQNSSAQITESASPKLFQSDAYQDGLDAAEGAASIIKSAVSKDDWILVASQLEKAIALMQSVPQRSMNSLVAKQKATEYQSHLVKVQQKIANWQEVETATIELKVRKEIVDSCSAKETLAALVNFLEKHPEHINEPIPEYAPHTWTAFSALEMAVLENCQSYVRLLISMGANVDNNNFMGLTPLHLAWKKDVAAILIAQGADLNATAHLVTKGSNRKKNVDVWGGLTPLHWIALYKNEFVKKYIDEKADVKDILDTAEFLLVKGANVNARDRQNKTPLSYAKQKDFLEMIELLKRHGGVE